MIDFHCHLLPGFDDGPRTLDEALAMARALTDFGFREVHCTPHCIAGHYEFSPVEVRAAVGRLQVELAKAGIPLRLHAGMEYSLDDGFERFAANLLPLGESRVVLCEAPPRALSGAVAALLDLIVVQGFIPLIAHPERSEMVWATLEAEWQTEHREAPPVPAAAPRPPFWRRWFSSPASTDIARKDTTVSTQDPVHSQSFPETCLYQANLGSFTGYYGPVPQRRAYELLQRKVYHCFASDLHDAASVASIFDPAREKLEFNPALQQLAAFEPPRGQAGNDQMAFW